MTAPAVFRDRRHGAAWMIRMGRALLRSNVPISEFISRSDNNANFEAAFRLIDCGRRIADGYGSGRAEKTIVVKRPVVGPNGLVGQRACPKCDAIGLRELPYIGDWCVSCRAVLNKKPSLAT